jgi:hypothetical protein
MELYWTQKSPINTAFVDGTGQTRYKIETPFRLTTRTTTISAVVASDLWDLIPDRKKCESESLDLTAGMEDQFAFLAQIEWRKVGSNKLRFGGDEFESKKYLRSNGLFSQLVVSRSCHL